MTLRLARWISSGSDRSYPASAYEAARNALLDWAAVTVAARDEAAVRILVDLYGADAGESTIVASRKRGRAADAALINGVAAHVLDYDDAVIRMSGHPGCSIISAAFALGEAARIGGEALLDAIITGYEAACYVGGVVGKTQYELGFHPTGTLGTIGSAAACARILRLDARLTANALGLAATQSAGLKGSFGTMAKPLHAGRAAMTGVMSAQMAQHGFTGEVRIIECSEGFAETHSKSPDIDYPSPDQASRMHIEDALFKYHAACHFTHPAIDAINAIRSQAPVSLEDVERITISISDRQKKVCDIREPETGLDLKFSIRQLAVMALDGVDTSDPSTYHDMHACDPRYRAAAQRVELVQPTDEGSHESTVTIITRRGDAHRARANVVDPSLDLNVTRRRLEQKAESLVAPIMGPQAFSRLVQTITNIESYSSIQALSELLEF